MIPGTKISFSVYLLIIFKFNAYNFLSLISKQDFQDPWGMTSDIMKMSFIELHVNTVVKISDFTPDPHVGGVHRKLRGQGFV